MLGAAIRKCRLFVQAQTICIRLLSLKFVFFSFAIIIFSTRTSFINVHGRMHNMQNTLCIWIDLLVSCIHSLLFLSLSLSRLFIFAINDKISFDACTVAAVAANVSAEQVEQCAYFFTRATLFLILAFLHVFLHLLQTIYCEWTKSIHLEKRKREMAFAKKDRGWRMFGDAKWM